MSGKDSSLDCTLQTPKGGQWNQAPIISLDLFKQLVRDELSVKYRGNRYRRLLERKEEVSAICWHSLAMEGQLL